MKCDLCNSLVEVQTCVRLNNHQTVDTANICFICYRGTDWYIQNPKTLPPNDMPVKVEVHNE